MKDCHADTKYENKNSRRNCGSLIAPRQGTSHVFSENILITIRLEIVLTASNCYTKYKTNNPRRKSGSLSPPDGTRYKSCKFGKNCLIGMRLKIVFKDCHTDTKYEDKNSRWKSWGLRAPGLSLIHI